MSTTLQKNVASQRIRVYAYTPADGKPKTGDAANLTCYIAKDYGAVTALTDTSATEEDATNAPGYYWFDISQTESNADNIMVTCKSATSGVYVLGAPAIIGTRPATGFLAPTTAGRTLDVSAGGEAGVDWANVGSPTTSLALTGTTIATTQKVDLETIKTQTVATTGAGTVTIPAAATLASTTNITAGTITTTTNVTNAVLVSSGSGAGQINLSSGKVLIQGTIDQFDDFVGATGKVTSLDTGAITAASFAAGAIDAAAIANGAIDNATFAADVGSTAIATNVIGIAAKKGVVDALNVDTYAEPGQETPAATNTLVKKIGYLFKAWRNKKDSDGTTENLYNDDAATVDQKRSLAEVAGTVTKGEVATGP